MFALADAASSVTVEYGNERQRAVADGSGTVRSTVAGGVSHHTH